MGDSHWDTCGWTYQEQILSRRAIYVTEFETFFSCNRASQQEGFGDIALLVKAKEHDNILSYFVTVNEYLRRDLTYAGDMMNAFTRVGNAFAKAQDAPLLYGLPGKFFSEALLWSGGQPQTRRTEALDIPTWSWAAWEGRSVYDQNHSIDISRTGNLVEFLTHDPKAGWRPLHEERKWFRTLPDITAGETLRDITPDLSRIRSVPGVEATIQSWTGCAHSPWDRRIHEQDPTMLARASSHPRSLMFTTTTTTLKFRRAESANLNMKSRWSESPNISITENGTMSTLDMLDREDRLVGRTTSLSVSWIEESMILRKGVEVVVLCAGIASEMLRSQKAQPFPHDSSYVSSTGHGEPWYLHIMIVERDESSVTHRIGLGFVAMRAWRQCSPRWEAIVLR